MPDSESKTPMVEITAFEQGALEAMASLQKPVVVIRALPTDPPPVQKQMYELESTMTKLLGLGFLEEITDQAKKEGVNPGREFRVFKPTPLAIQMFGTERSCGDPDCDNCKGEDLPIKQWVN